MDFAELISKRKSVRGYLPDALPAGMAEKLAETALKAPSAANRQPWRIDIIYRGELFDRVAASYPRGWFAEAPVIVVFSGLPGESWVRSDGADYLLCDVTILADHFIMLATENGLGTCWIAAFDRQMVKDALGFDDRIEPMILTPLGYAKENSTRETARKCCDATLFVHDEPKG